MISKEQTKKKTALNSFITMKISRGKKKKNQKHRHTALRVFSLSHFEIHSIQYTRTKQLRLSVWVCASMHRSLLHKRIHSERASRLFRSHTIRAGRHAVSASASFVSNLLVLSNSYQVYDQWWNLLGGYVFSFALLSFSSLSPSAAAAATACT